ncbi:sulfotransferase [Sphingomonas sp.]|uniref:tetratricopeptide repeat-containing sulfotransferase family protein n=1 Tax=Sphingomonas sp. TaxID=28214 RepID=UPI003B3B4DD0
MHVANHELIGQARQAVRSGDYMRAESLAGKVLRAAPDMAEALEILFLCQQARQDHAGAEGTLRRIVRLMPTKQWPRGDLARLLLAAGRESEAEAVLREAIAIDDRHGEAHAMLGGLLSERETLIPGAHHLRRAIDLSGKHPQLLANLGRNLMRQGRLEEAEPLLRDACAAAPDLLLPAVHLAELAEQQDRFDDAIALLDRAERIARRQGRDVIAQRAQLLSRTPRWQDALDLLDGLPDLAGTALLLRARLRDRARRFEAAWTDAVAAKAQLARMRGHAYARQTAEALFAAMANLAQQPLVDVHLSRSSGVPQPIFILGFPRSGTTMVEQVLASHSRVRAGGELPFLNALPVLIERACGRPLGLAVKQLQDEKIVGQIHDFYMRQAADHGLLAPGADFFTDKMPLNEVYLPILRLAFPDAPVVAVQRDPRDVIVSAMQHDMTHGFHCAYRAEDAARHFAAVSDLTSNFKEMGIDPYVLRYERFVTDQANETAQLMAVIGLPPEPAQEEFHKVRRHAPTPSYAQVREPLHRRAAGRWHNYADQLAAIQPILAKAVARGGY